MESYKFEVTSIDNRAVIVKLPEVVVSGDEAMKFTSLVNELSSSQPKLIIIDFSSVDLMNSTGLGMIAGTHNNLAKAGIDLYLVNLSDKVLKLLTMTHLDQVLKVRKDTDTVLNEI